MSVTFSIPGVSKTRINRDFVCAECKATPANPSYNQDCSICMGYGSDPNDDPLGTDSMNVANAAARIILHTLLGYGQDEKDGEYGSLNPRDVLSRLATAESRVPGAVRRPSDNQGVRIDANGVRPVCRVIDFGMNQDRIQRYVDTLREMAEKALAAGSEIAYS